MAQLSRRHLDPQLETALKQQLSKTIQHAVNHQQLGLLTENLFSRTEQLMLAKRFMAFALLWSDWNPYAVAETLKLSTNTVYKLKSQLENSPEFEAMLASQLVNKIPFEADTDPGELIRQKLEENTSKLLSGSIFISPRQRE